MSSSRVKVLSNKTQRDDYIENIDTKYKNLLLWIIIGESGHIRHTHMYVRLCLSAKHFFRCLLGEGSLGIRPIAGCVDKDVLVLTAYKNYK